MNVKDVLEKVVILLGLDDIKIGTQQDTPLTDKRMIHLINSINMVYLQLITEFVPLERVDRVVFDQNVLLLLSLPQKLYDVVSLKDLQGNNIKYKLLPDCIFCNVGNQTVLELAYYYTINEYLGLESNFEITPKVTLNLLAKGVAAEYALENMMFEEAVLYDKKYKEGLHTVLAFKSEREFMTRRWI